MHESLAKVYKQCMKDLFNTLVLTTEVLVTCRGEVYVNESMKEEDLPVTFVTEKAPRTAISVHMNGTLSLVQVCHLLQCSCSVTDLLLFYAIVAAG